MRRYVLPLALLMAPLCAFAQELSDSRLIQLNRMTSPPASRTSRRPVLAPEYGGWTVYTGQMHAHTRGHDESVIALPRTLTYAYRYGWDFFARTNHTSSWESYDSNRGFRENYVEAPWTDNMLVVHGIESHLDIYSDPGTHRLHYNTFNGWARTYGGDMSDMSDEVLPRYHPDPLPVDPRADESPGLQHQRALQAPRGREPAGNVARDRGGQRGAVGHARR
ncbi:hypothetical protein [Archangium violaceum]|uniref:hypothetical protein n=1 Tax=Archangium violaceum TaxID=83451 RepID=UPI0036DC2F75